MAKSIQKVPAYRQYYALAVKPKERDAWYHFIVHILRPISTRISWLIAHTPISANMVSVFMTLVGISSTFFFALGGYANNLIGAFLLYFDLILDSVDGEIARFKKQTSLRGIYIDEVHHNLVQPLILIGLGTGQSRLSGDVSFLYLGTAAAFFFLLCEAVRMIRQILLVSHQKGNARDLVNTAKILRNKQSGFKSFLVAAGVSFFNLTILDAMSNILLLLAIFNLTYYGLLFYSILIPLRWLVLLFVYSKYPNIKPTI